MADPDYPIELCRGFTTSQWKELRPRLETDDDEAWDYAIDVFRRRLNERFTSSIEALIAADSHADSTRRSQRGDGSDLLDEKTQATVVPGFAITALCCLLVETLQTFREGPSNDTAGQFERFLAQPAFRGEFGGTKFAAEVRHKVLHEAETRNWLIRRTSSSDQIVKSLKGGRYILYRNEFYDAIKREFSEYTDSLRSDSDPELRTRFLKQMDRIVKGS